MKNVLVTGGSGQVGKYLKDIMPTANYISSKDYNLLVESDVIKMYKDLNPDIVIHLAARCGGIQYNVSHPVQLLEENVLMNTLVLKHAYNSGVKRFLGILSSCVYPDQVESYPMIESQMFEGAPPPTNFAYAISKRCLATQIDSYNAQYNTKYNYLMPCNLYGEYDKYEEHHSHYVSALIKKIYTCDNNIVKLYGTGKPLRQFMYTGDLAKVIKYLIDNDIVDNFNVAPKEVYTIKEIAEIAVKSIGKDYKIDFSNEGLDGQFRKDVDSSKLLSVLKDFEFTSLNDGIKKSYEHIVKTWNKDDKVSN